MTPQQRTPLLKDKFAGPNGVHYRGVPLYMYTATYLHSSSSSRRRPVGFFAIRSRHSVLSTNSTDSHWIPSPLYSSCNHGNNSMGYELNKMAANLFEFEYVLIEVLLKLFICIIYTKLLKRVILEYFKAKYVQYTNTVPLMNTFIETNCK